MASKVLLRSRAPEEMNRSFSPPPLYRQQQNNKTIREFQSISLLQGWTSALGDIIDTEHYSVKLDSAVLSRVVRLDAHSTSSD